jgi:hypothetical protein
MNGTVNVYQKRFYDGVVPCVPELSRFLEVDVQEDALWYKAYLSP